MGKYHLDTSLAQTGNRSESVTGTVNPPVYFSTAYRHAGIGQSTGFDYTRTGNPTRKILEQSIADLEGGTAGFAFSSGMAAIQATFAIFNPGDEFIVTQDVYGGSYRIFENHFKKFGLHFHYVNSTDTEDFKEKISENTKGIFIETPTNPLMTQLDIDAFSRLAKAYGLLLIVDNTFFTPYIQRPLEQGADIVLHSGTKYLGGHNDVLAGLVVAKDEKIGEEIGLEQNSTGAVLSPFDSWLMMRGMKTLGLRMKQHEQNARAVVAFLKENPYVKDVLYPGRGGMISFRVQEEEAVPRLLEQIELITFAESLGGVETFITYPATQTHYDIPEDIRSSYGVCNRLLRMSVGIENDLDIINDLEQALAASHQETQLPY
ncbi:methionine biosynthesis PLP-dependent protein [Thalassobacillus pellis]|uniref:methionine biosynthesis PLP-dependent protein n=1 Tax=Thalassobacillus pellis TaxID=748008 RepID=UPI00195F97E0|nr:methionine biosynthesis PLP-dependent protein [Thalassobacillus pellis]MBM7553654.1 cystathionine gamma-synthase [Thalassobacillus pellis]